MKKILTLCFLLSLSLVHAQDLQIPNTPAFSILGYEPSAVMRPNNTKKLSSDILNSFDKDGKLLMNLGMEVAPYWLTSHDTLSRQQYLDPTAWQSFKQTFTLSAATVKDSVSGNNNLGVGFRVQLVSGKVSHDFTIADKQLNGLETVISAIGAGRSMAGTTILNRNALIDSITNYLKTANISANVIAGFRAKATERAAKYDDSAGSMKLLCEELIASYEPETDALAKKVIELENKRTGFSLEIASAAKFITTTGNQGFRKVGVWANANNYFTDTDAWTITARWMTTVTDTTMANFDAGIGYIKQGKDFNISVEGMVRWYRSEIPDFNSALEPILRVEKDFAYRLAAEASYTLTENVSFNISVGKDFKDPKFNTDSYFSIFGLNYSLFNAQKIKPQ
jgi:hypothetical protein